ncbi:hypothetical protein ILUMI_06988 [Ignelater luminosus]|uniref:Uncharacterized protein n=1 Tax=Ignelater luminosus TaxID=2038154 RepID=A0A8K0DEE2_IGNLU|nr:hypothetical protein ILUMI_06988 [Ignelater luminosus]
MKRKHIFRQIVIKTPEKYWELYFKIGEIRKLGTKWILINIKGVMNHLKKIQGISSCKRIHRKKGKVPNSVLVKRESFYRTTDPTKRFETLLKQRKRLEQVTLTELALDPELGWIVPIFTENQENEHAESTTDEECECAVTDNVDFV